MRLIHKLLPRGLWPLWAAGLISTTGDTLHQVAIMWLIYELTGSQIATGLIGMAQYLPAVLVGMMAGAAVDRWNRKHVMIVADGARALLVTLIPILYVAGHMSGLSLGILAFAIAVFTTLFYPARESIIPQVVERKDLTRASSVLQATYGSAYFFGPVVAAALLPWTKITGLFYADAISYLASLAFLLRLRPKPIPASEFHTVSPWHLVREGLAFARSNGLIYGLLMVTAVDNLFIMGPALVGAPLYVRLHLGLGAGAYAAVQAAFALGMMVGSVAVHRLSRRYSRGKLLLWAIMWDGITFVPLMFATSLLAVLVIWFVHSLGIPFILVPRTTLVQTEVPADLQGRVFSMVNLTVVGLSAISCALTGMVAAVLPVHQLYAVIGVSATVVGGIGWHVRDLRMAT